MTVEQMCRELVSDALEGGLVVISEDVVLTLNVTAWTCPGEFEGDVSGMVKTLRSFLLAEREACAIIADCQAVEEEEREEPDSRGVIAADAIAEQIRGRVGP